MTSANDDDGPHDVTGYSSATPAVIVTDPEVMGGSPCFAGTRVPASIVVESVDRGVSWERLVASYPFLTAEHLSAARVFLASRGGRRPGLNRLLGTVVECKVVRPARRGTTED